MIPRKPYLLRAMVEWAEDNALTPLIAVDATVPGVRVPAAYVEEGRITLNISFSALNQRQISNELVTGHARFGGRSEYLEVPLAAVSALVVRETGEGMVFPDEETPPPDAPPPQDGGPTDAPPKPPRGRPKLKVVK